MALYSPLFTQWKMKLVKNELHLDFPVSLQEGFAPSAPLRGSSTGMMARAVVEPVETSSRSRSLGPGTSCRGGWLRVRDRWMGCLHHCWRRRLMGGGTVPVPRATKRSPYAGVAAWAVVETSRVCPPSGMLRYFSCGLQRRLLTKPSRRLFLKPRRSFIMNLRDVALSV